jgi:dTDP-4-dehydrorhamnose 3,5-epimerase
MIFNKLPLSGAYIIELEIGEDDRGFFARYFCAEEYRKYGLDPKIVQINNSYCKKKGTIRGIHFQLPPMAEAKIVRCIKGSFWDVMVDLRKDSPTFGEWCGETLSSENRKMMYIPKGFGHAFITLEDDTESLYLVTEYYSPKEEIGIMWNDDELDINWPIKNPILSEKDTRNMSFQEFVNKYKGVKV